MGCHQSRARGGVGAGATAVNYDNCMSPRAIPANLTPPLIGMATPPILPERGEPLRIGLAELPQDYQRLIVDALYVDNMVPGRTPRCRGVFIQFKGEVPLAGIALSTVSGTLWENLLYPNEPGRPQGIAHLVEHLIYSKPSPDAPDVRQWFADRNGDSNACTTDSDMRLWLCVPPKFVKEALSMMTLCMYGRDSYGDSKELEREMLSVDEEYAGMSDQYEVRVVSLLKKICHPANPWHNCFTCGNSKTLSESIYPDIRERCKEFHLNVLKQQDMNLCIVSSHTCAEMIQMAKECIAKSRIGEAKPTKALPLRRTMPQAFTSGKNLPALLILDAFEWKCEFRFVLPEFKGQHSPIGGDPEDKTRCMSWKSQLLRMQGAMSFISHMFRQQTPGSFLTVLLEKGLTYGVSGCRSYAGIEQNFFDIEFLVDENYTEDGDPEGLSAEDPATQGVVWLRLMRRIGRALFSYLKLLSSEFSKDPENFQAYNDFKIIKDFQYQSTNGPDALTLSNEITSKLSSCYRRGIEIDEDGLTVAPDGIKTTNSLAPLIIDPPPYDHALDMADAVAELVDQHLVIDNAICILAGPQFSSKQYPTWLTHRGSWLLDKEGLKADALLKGLDPSSTPTIIWETDPWFGTKYTICELPDKIADYCRSQNPSIQQKQKFDQAAAVKTDVTTPQALPDGGAKTGGVPCTSDGGAPLRRHGSLFAAECLETSFTVNQHNRFLPKNEDLKLQRLDSIFSRQIKPGDNTQVSVITPSKTMVRVGQDVLPATAQLYLHRHETDVVGMVQCTARFFLPCLQPEEAEVGKIHRQGTMVDLGKNWDSSGFLTKMLLGRVILRCLANRLRAVSNEAAVAGINFAVNLTSPMNEGQVALELSISGYSGSNTRDLFRFVFDNLLATTEEGLGDITRCTQEVTNMLQVQATNCKYDSRSQLNPNLGLILIPISIPTPSQLKVLQTIEAKDVLKFVGIKKGWTVADMFKGATVMCAIGGNVSVNEAISEWMNHCLMEPLRNRHVELGDDSLIQPSRSSQDGIERLPFHVAVMELDHVTTLMPDFLKAGKQTEVYPYGDVLNNPMVPNLFALTPDDPGEVPLGLEYLYAYNSNDNGRIVQININSDTEPHRVGLLIVLLKAIEQEFFSWIRDVNNLAYYLSVTLKTVGLDGSVLSFAVCSTTATLEQLLLCSLQIIDVPRGSGTGQSGEVPPGIENSLSKVWTSEEAFNDLRDSVVHMLREDSDVEGLGNRHRVLIGGLFSGTHDYDSNIEVADFLAKTTHADMLKFTHTVLKQRSRLIQLSCDAQTAANYGVQGFEYYQGVAPAAFKPSKNLVDLVNKGRAIDGRNWLQLRDPRSLHRLVYAAEDAAAAAAKKRTPTYERKPRAYRRGTVSITKNS